MSRVLRPLCFTILSTLFACTTQIDNGRTPAIDAASIDAEPLPDALPPGLRDGERCVVTSEDETGGCAPGLICAVVGQGLSACRQTCENLQFSCPGYEGPGFSLCALNNGDSTGPEDAHLCLVVCGDANETLRGCDDGSCDGTCPGSWSCQPDPVNFGLMTCQ